MKGSAYVPLLILGSVVTINTLAHRNDLDVTQQEYASRDDCEMDWGEVDHCYQTYNGSSSGAHYVGPRYYWDRELGKPIEVLPDGSTRVLNNSRLTVPSSTLGNSVRVGSYSRGGFGTFGRGFSAGG